MTEDKKEVKEKEEYKLVKVPTGEALAIQTPEGEVMQTEYALVELLNLVKEIKAYLLK
jgi:hypothetical protein